MRYWPLIDLSSKVLFKQTSAVCKLACIWHSRDLTVDASCVIFSVNCWSPSGTLELNCFWYHKVFSYSTLQRTINLYTKLGSHQNQILDRDNEYSLLLSLSLPVFFYDVIIYTNWSDLNIAQSSLIKKYLFVKSS